MIKRFRQGDLDGLCGAYALVNALTQRVMQQRNFAHDEADRVFRHVVRSIPQNLFPDVVIDGMTNSQLLRVGKSMAEFVASNYGRVLKVTSPWKSRTDITSVTKFLNEVSDLHSNRPTAFVFGLSYYGQNGASAGGHWVAFKEFKPHGIQVVNNGKNSFVRSVSMRVNGTGLLRLDFQDTIMLETTSVDGEPPNFTVGR